MQATLARIGARPGTLARRDNNRGCPEMGSPGFLLRPSRPREEVGHYATPSSVRGPPCEFLARAVKRNARNARFMNLS
jgi:hypothetical protein